MRGENSSDDAGVSRLRKWVASLGKQTAGAVVTTITLSLGFLVFNDFVAPPPSLAGRWKFTVTYEDTSMKRFQGMQVTYQVLLVQEGLVLKGSGEKVSATPPNQDTEEYDGPLRIPIEISGMVRRNYFSPSQVAVHYKEEGVRRPTSTIHNLRYQNSRTLCGCFITTIANTSGTVWWERVESRQGIYDPVSYQEHCAGVHCSGT